MLRKLLFLLVFGSMIYSESSAQLTAVIGTGTSVPGNTLYAPFYRFSNSSTTDYSRSNILYTQAELAAVGILPGIIISKLSFFKNGAGASLGDASFSIWMRNSSTTPPLSIATTWANITSTHTQVYNTTTQTVPAAAGWVDFTLGTAFTYTGGSLEIAFDWDCSGIVGNPATDKYDWVYTPGFASHIVGQTSTSTPPATLNATIAGYLERPNIQFTYASGFTLDGALTAFTSPTSICPSTTPIIADFANSGSNNITSATIAWSVNGIPQTAYTYSGSLAQGSSASVTLGSVSFLPATNYDIVANLTDVNGLGVDSNSVNDTISLLNFTTGLQGVYTINKTLPATATNFVSFTAFADALNNRGVCGAVIANVLAGPYTEQFSLGQVNGVSGTNTITINGNNQELNFAPTAGGRHVVKLDGTDYITIDNLQVKGTDPTYGWGIFLTNSADFVTIQNCTVDLGAITSTSSVNSGGIVVSGSTTSMTTVGNNANVCRILNNTVKGGATGGPYYGITMCGNTSGPGAINCEIKGNTVQDFYIYGLYCNQTQSILVENNEFTRPTFNTTSSPYPMYFTGGQIAGKVNANKIHNTNGGNPNGTNTAYGIYVANGGGFGQNLLVSNNIMYNVNNSGAVYAMYVSSAKNIDYLHNSIAIDNASATGTSLARGFYLTGTNDSLSIKNNLVSITRGGTGTFHGIYVATVPSVWDENNNNIYVNSATSTNNHFGYSGSNRTTLLDWQTTTTQGANDQVVLPIFADAANGDLKPSAASLNNAGQNVLSLVPNDFLGVARTATPDIGAYEFTPITDDAGATLITTATCAGSQDVFVKVRNFGLVTLDSVVVSASMNGVPTSLSGTNFIISVASGADTTLNIGTFTFVPNVTYNGLAFTNLPNGSVDANKSNDTATLANFNLGLNGTYTVNSAVVTGGINFQTFADLTAVLNTVGVCGPVVVNTVVGSGPYNEQVLLDDVLGTSSVNTITINGNGETLTFLSSTTAQRAGFSLNETDYVTIDSFNIVAQGTTTSNYGFGVHLIGQANHNIIKNNTITLDSTLTSSNYAGIAISGSSTSASTAGANGNYNTIENNTIVGGYYGISAYGQSSTIHTVGNSFLKNKIFGFYYYGLTAYYQDSVRIEDNTVIQRSASSTSYGIYPYYSNDINVVRNKVVLLGTSTDYGIYPYYVNVNGTHTGRSLVANNFVTCMNTATTMYGIYPYNCRELNIYHNTINVFDGSATAGRALYLNSSTTGAYDVEVMNNIIVNEGTGYGVEISSGANTLGYVTRMDNNNIYTPNGTLGRYNNVNYLTLADWTAASQKDSNSFSVIPLFNSPTDLHIVSNVLNNKGAVGLGVTDDIDGDVRCPLVGCAGSTLRPDIGADEFLGAPITVDLGVDELVSPTQKACYSTTETVSVKIHNYNNTTIYFSADPATLKVSVAGTNPTTFANVTLNTDSLMSDSTMVVTLPGTYDMSALGMYDFTVIISQVDDVIKFNDTLRLTLENTIGEIANTYAQICSGSPFELKMNNTPAGASVQWQLYNPTTMMWVNETALGSDSVAYMVAPTAYAIYRAEVCGIHFSGSDTLDPIVVTPPTAMNDTICVGETSQLIASSAMGNTHQWYASSSSTTPIFVGDTLSAAFTMDTTVYVEASQTLAGGTGLLKITKIDIGGPDGIEIQNLSNQAINTTGWTVAISNSYTDINNVNTILWNLPASIPSGQMDYKIDASGANYWGNNILWNPGAYPSFTGWAMILDNTGKIVDAIFLNWLAADIAGMNTTINGFPITITNEWVGDGVSKVGIPTGTFIARVGNSDNDDLNDFNQQTTPYLTQNVGLSIPFIGGSCTSTRTAVSVKVNASPVVNLGADTAVCAGASVTLDAGNAGATFLWNDASTMQTLTATTANTYSVAVTNAGCTGRDTIVVTVNANPVVSLGADTAICAGASVTLNAANAGSSYAWSTTATTQTVSATMANNYSVVVTDGNGCKGTDTIMVSVNANPVVNLGADTAICAGASVTLNAANAGSSYAWSTTATTQTVSATMANNYSVVVTDGNGCKGTDTIMVSVNANPVVNLGRDTAICAGASVTLDAANAGSSYAWSTSATTQTVSATMANSYSVVVTNTNGCKGRDTVVVSVNAIPTVTLTSSKDTACQNSGAITLIGTPVGGAFSGTNVTGNSFSPATVGNQTVSYAVTDANGCSNTATKTIVVKLCTGIDDNIEIAASVYPVPMSSEVFVELPALSKTTSIALYATDGRLVMTKTIDASSATIERLEVSQFAAGIYTLRITSLDKVFTTRLIKE